MDKKHIHIYVIEKGKKKRFWTYKCYSSTNIYIDNFFYLKLNFFDYFFNDVKDNLHQGTLGFVFFTLKKYKMNKTIFKNLSWLRKNNLILLFTKL